MTIMQDTFTQYAQLGYHAAINTNFKWWAASPLAEGGGIGFGVAVAYGTSYNQAVPVPEGTTAGDIIGITLRTQAVENTLINGEQVPVYSEGKAMSALTKGRMFLVVPDGSTAGQPVYAVPGTGEIVSTATGNIALPRARFVRTVGAGETTEIELA